MPEFVFLLGCERVIDAANGTVSFINLLDGFVAPFIPGTPTNAVVPYRWFVVNLWRQLPEDEGRKYVQQIDLVQPDGNVIGTAEVNFQVKADGARCSIELNLFPVGQAGTVLVKLRMRQEESSDWREIASYPIRVMHQGPAVPSDAEHANPIASVPPS